MFPRFDRPPPAVLEKVLFGAGRQVVLPSLAESLARSLERCCGTDADLARLVRLRIEAERPTPLVDIVRNAGTLSDRADANVVIEDAPGFLMHVLHAAAGEGGHGRNLGLLTPGF